MEWEEALVSKTEAKCLPKESFWEATPPGRCHRSANEWGMGNEIMRELTQLCYYWAD